MNYLLSSTLSLFLAFAFFVPSASAQMLNTSLKTTIDVGATDNASGTDVSADTDVSASNSDTEEEESAPLSAKILQNAVVSTPVDGEMQVTNALDVRTDKSLKAYATSAVRSDERLSSVEFDSDTMDVRYKKPARFLGFIPASMTVTVDVTESGDVSLRYPWYAFLMSVDTKQTDLETKLQADVAAMIGGRSAGTVTDSTLNGSASTSLTGSAGMASAASASASIDNRTRALILERIQAILSADASASAS